MEIRFQDRREEVAVFRAEVIGSLLRRDLPHGQLRAEFEALSRQPFRPPDSPWTKTFSVPTLERWYYAYRKGGLAALRPKRRDDSGHGRALPEELRELLLDIRRLYPSLPATLIRDTLITDGRLDKQVASVSTLQRLYRECDLPRMRERDRDRAPRQRLRWEAESPMALWHGDVCHGPALTVGGRSVPLRVHALLDDASRYIVAIEAHHTEQEVDMLGVLSRALRRHGCCDVLYLDNGPTYRGEVLSVACARLGIGLVHAKPYDPQARGKMERFWRTLRERCLDHLGPMSSLHEVQVRLHAYVDHDYHQRPHAGLVGRTPQGVWQRYWRGVDSAARRVDDAALRAAMTERTRRRVRKDSTLSHEGMVWELTQGYLAGRIVTVAHCLLDEPVAPWVEHDERVFALHPVAPKANGRKGRAALPGHSSDTTNAAEGAKALIDPVGARLDAVLGRTTRKRKTQEDAR